MKDSLIFSELAEKFGRNIDNESGVCYGGT